MSRKKMDRKLVATEENEGSEVYTISGKYDVPVDVVRQVMMDKGKNGKPARSRKVIYAALRELSYPMTTIAKKQVVAIPPATVKVENVSQHRIEEQF